MNEMATIPSPTEVRPQAARTHAADCVQGANRPPAIRGWQFSGAEIDSVRKCGRMLMLCAETSDLCDLRCVYCYRDAGNRPGPDDLTILERLHLVDEAADLGCISVHLVGAGEPLLDRFFWQQVTHISRKGLVPLVFTNGTRVTGEVARRLFDLGCSVIVKANSLDPYAQDRLAGVNGYAAQRDRALATLLAIGFADEVPTRLGVDSVITKANLKELPSLVRWCREHNIFPEIKPCMPVGKARERLELEVDAGSVRAIAQEVHRVDQEFGFEYPVQPPYLAGFPCRQLELGVYVDIHGAAFPCPGARLRLGDVRKHGLAAVWYGSAMRRVREIFTRLEGHCATCDLFKNRECYGCPARRNPRPDNPDRLLESRGCWEDNT